jgi:hypothetical protein
MERSKSVFTESTVGDDVDNALKKYLGPFGKLRDKNANRADSALALSILALCRQQSDKSKAKELLDLFKTFGF